MVRKHNVSHFITISIYINSISSLGDYLTFDSTDQPMSTDTQIQILYLHTHTNNT